MEFNQNSISLEVINRLIDLKTNPNQESLADILTETTPMYQASVNSFAEIIDEAECIFAGYSSWNNYIIKLSSLPKFFRGPLYRYLIQSTNNNFNVKKIYIIDNLNCTKGLCGKYTFIDKIKVKILLLYLFNKYRTHKNEYNGYMSYARPIINLDNN